MARVAHEFPPETAGGGAHESERMEKVEEEEERAACQLLQEGPRLIVNVRFCTPSLP